VKLNIGTSVTSALVAALFTLPLYAQPDLQGQARPNLDVPYVPTPQDVVEAMLEVAEVGEDDLVYDLGSGDGRIVIAAVEKYGARRGVGVDLDPQRVAEARENARQAGVEDRVEFIEGDLFKVDFTDATVLTLYLFPSVNLKLRPQILAEMEPGTRIVSHSFDMGDWRADQRLDVNGRTVHFWVVPAEVAGTWRWRTDGEQEYRLQLEQEFQQVRGAVEVGGEQIPIRDAQLVGKRLAFAFDHPQHGTQRVETQLDGDRLVGLAQPAGEELVAEREERGTMAMGDTAERD
jgi:SAM-dependent methyltransferase